MKRTKQDKRPSSDNFVDLHLFVVPHELWMEKYRTTYNNSTLESISAGFVRVAPVLNMCDLRIQIKEQLGGGDVIPEDYVFLRCVGRCLAIVSKTQEFSLKVKHFLPPVVPSPEIFVLFGTHESLSYSLASSLVNGSDTREYVSGYLSNSRDLDNDSRSSTERSDDRSPEIKDYEGREESSSDARRRVRFDSSAGQDRKKIKDEVVDQSNAVCTNEAEARHDDTFLHGKSSAQKDAENTPTYSTSAPAQEVTREQSSNSQSSRRRHSGERSVQAAEHPQKPSENENPLEQLKATENSLQERAKEDSIEESMKEKKVGVSSLHEEPGTQQPAMQLSSGQEPRTSPSDKTQRKKRNPLLHSKTAPALMEGSFNEAKNENQSEIVKKTDDIAQQSALVNSENNDLVDISTEISHNNKQNPSTPRSASGTTNRTYSNTRESTAKRDISEKENDLGVTIADKENLVLQLQAELSAVRTERSSSEKAREQLLKKAKNLQNQNNQKRSQARNIWKKRYFEEKKCTVSLEERCNQLRYEVDVLHKKLLSSTDSKDHEGINSAIRHEGDPEKVNNKIMLTRKENEVEELKRRVEEAKIKLGSEMKLRDTAQKELKHLRDEVIDKKINATLVKKSLSLLETRPSNMQI